jgi:hypothetical protein
MEIAALLVVLVFCGCFAAYVFAPLVRRPAVGKTPQYQLADVFSLVALWQYPLLLIRLIHKWQVVQRPIQAGEYLLGGAFLLVVTGMWFELIRTLSCLGVQHSARRFVIVAIAAPLGIAISLALVPALLRLCRLFLRPDAEADKSAAIVVGLCLAIGLACRAAFAWGLRPQVARESADR